MRQSRSLALGLTALTAATALAAIGGGRRQPTSDADPRPSSFLATPGGAEALAESLERLGIAVVRLRRHQPRTLVAESTRGLEAVLDPTLPLTSAEAGDLAALPSQGVSLLVAGPRAGKLLACLGFRTVALADSAPVAPVPGSGPPPFVRVGLQRTRDTVVVDSAGMFDTRVRECHVPHYRRIDTLLMAGGTPAAVDLDVDGTTARVILVGDVNLVRNRTLRDTDAGVIVLGWVAGRFETVWFDEYHHGYLAAGSLQSWTFQWSRESPWGWLVWHLAIVGLIAIGAGAIRFGPPHSAIDRRRRSVTEHVRALARALRTSRGHRRAVTIIISGLRRRLSPGGRSSPASLGEWLDRTGTGSANPTVRLITGQLKQLEQSARSEGAVLSAANLVEDLWSEMRT